MRIKFTKDESKEFLNAYWNNDHEALERLLMLEEVYYDESWRKEFEGNMGSVVKYEDVDFLDSNVVDYDSQKTADTFCSFILAVTLFHEYKRKWDEEKVIA